MAAALLNVVQSADERQPVTAPDAVLQPMAKPDPMTDCPAVAVMPPLDVIVPVATVPRVEGVPIPVQYANCPIVGVVDVETFPENKVGAVKPPRVPDQSPVVLRLNDVPLYVSPVPAVVVAPEYIVPLADTASSPCDRAGIWRVPEIVEEPVAKNEFAPTKPSAVEVET